MRVPITLKILIYSRKNLDYKTELINFAYPNNHKQPMMKRRLVLIAALLMMSGLAGRAESNYLHVATDKGWEVIDLTQADRMTFNGGTMTVSDATGNILASYPQASLDRMYVDQNTAVAEIPAGDSEAKFRISADGRSVELLAHGSFEIYSLDGALLVSISGAAPGKTVELSGLKTGIYIFRLGDYSVKCSIN